MTLLALVLVVMLTACVPADQPIPHTLIATPLPPSPSPILPTTPLAALEGKFDVGGVRLFLSCQGQGHPTIVLDAGWGDDSHTWSKIIPDLRALTQVCVYDRASLGKSDDQGGERTSQEIAGQLHRLLGIAKIEAPYIMVGHSLGGVNVLLFADGYPTEVAGIVLIDSVHPDQADRWLAALPTPAATDNQALMDLRAGLPWHNRQCIPETMNWTRTLAQARAVKSLGNMPLVVLVATDPTRTDWGDIQPEVAARLDQIWLDLHMEYLTLSTDSHLIRAEHSGHFIQTDEPQLVIDAILDMVDKVRQK
ncbi:MAG: alpha/beta hydrolase [Anaerolineae bacterium]